VRKLNSQDRKLKFGRIDSRGQFHQPYGAKRKCAGNHSLALLGTIQFHQQNYAELHHYAQLENTLNFYSVRPALFANKFSVNQLVEKLPVEHW
jgi:hypothetical protein